MADDLDADMAFELEAALQVPPIPYLPHNAHSHRWDENAPSMSHDCILI